MGRSLDIFMNGKLRYNFLLEGIPNLPKNNIEITPLLQNNLSVGYNGYFNNLSYTNKGLNMDEIISIYKKGPLLK